MNDFLPPARRQTTFEFRFWGHPAVKDAIESLGIPHTEVDLILINGSEASFSRPLTDGDRVSVYPVFESIDIGSVISLRARPLREPRFILDVHLGRLATSLRLLGFDTDYANVNDDAELSVRAVRDGRILLTRDRGLLKRAAIDRGYCVRSTDPTSQAVEVVNRFDLTRSIRPFSRCLACNGLLEPVAMEEVAADLPPRVAELHDHFTRCERCGRVYWQGSHYQRLKAFVETILAGTSSKGADG